LLNAIAFRSFKLIEIFGHDTNIPPRNGFARQRLIIANAVNLQRNESRFSHIVEQIGTCYAVNPRANRISDSFDAGRIPFIVFKCFFRIGIVSERIEPSTARFVINTSCPGTCRGIDFELIAMNTAIVVFFQAVAAKLYTRIESVIHFEIEFEDEVVVHFVGCQKSIRSTRFGNADNSFVFNLIFGRAIELCPALQIFAIEQILPFGFLCR
jgi:hypothetical protein